MIGSVGASIAMAMVPAALLGGCAEEILNTQPFEPTVWYSIDPSGAISVKVTKAEMGQHVEPHWHLSWQKNLKRIGVLLGSTMSIPMLSMVPKSPAAAGQFGQASIN
jgi:hypothetical protein